MPIVAYLCGMAEGTLQDLRDALWDNADFEETGSVSKARAYITAATRWLSLEASSHSDQGSSLGFPVQQLENRLRRAERYVAANASSTANTAKVRFLTAQMGFRR